MDIKSLFKNYIFPYKIDFLGMLQEQSLATHKTINDLYECFINGNEKNCLSIIKDEHKTETIKNRNMKILLNAFITPIDRESIYRAITQFDWMSISVKNFVLEAKAYKVDELIQYKDILYLIYKASQALNEGANALNANQHAKVSKISSKIRELTDEINQKYIQEMVKLSQNEDFKKVFIYKELLTQLKEIGRRLHISANTLQDMVVKMD